MHSMHAPDDRATWSTMKGGVYSRGADGAFLIAPEDLAEATVCGFRLAGEAPPQSSEPPAAAAAGPALDLLGDEEADPPPDWSADPESGL